MWTEEMDGAKDNQSVSTHIVNVVQSSVWKGGLLPQPEVSADEQLSTGDGGRVLQVGQALHHHC